MPRRIRQCSSTVLDIRYVAWINITFNGTVPLQETTNRADCLDMIVCQRNMSEE